MRARVAFCLLLSLAAAAASGASPTAAAAEPAPRPGITVFAAASLTESVGELAQAYEKRTGIPVTTSFASSGTLAHQIDAGARADLFISADTAWMDKLEEQHRIQAGTRRNLLRNALVLIAPASSTVKLSLGPQAPVLAALRGGRLALADPDSVPAGRYARAAFTSFRIWSELEPQIIRAEDVRAALAWVARGEAALGVVYATDAIVESKVRVVDAFPASSHPPIVYPMAVVDGAVAGAADFESYLESADGRAVFAKHGFASP